MPFTPGNTLHSLALAICMFAQVAVFAVHRESGSEVFYTIMQRFRSGRFGVARQRGTRPELSIDDINAHSENAWMT